MTLLQQRSNFVITEDGPAGLVFMEWVHVISNAFVVQNKLYYSVLGLLLIVVSPNQRMAAS